MLYRLAGRFLNPATRRCLSEAITLLRLMGRGPIRQMSGTFPRVTQSSVCSEGIEQRAPHPH